MVIYLSNNKITMREQKTEIMIQTNTPTTAIPEHVMLLIGPQLAFCFPCRTCLLALHSRDNGSYRASMFAFGKSTSNCCFNRSQGTPAKGASMSCAGSASLDNIRMPGEQGGLGPIFLWRMSSLT